MKLILSGLLALFTLMVTHTALAREKLVLSITGEDIAGVVQEFNQSQSDYLIVLKNQTYRNWQFAINRFRFTQKGVERGASNGIIDIAFVDNNWLAGMIQDRWLEDITGKIARTDYFINGLTNAASENGRLYALPFCNKGLVLFYRRDLHEKYGLPLPRTLKELARNARLLMEQEHLEHGLTLHFSAIHLDILPFLWSNGGGIIEKDRVIVNHSSNVEVLTALQALTKNRVLPDRAGFEALKGAYTNAKKKFMEGKSAYILTWNNRTAGFEKSSIARKFGILPVPSFKKGQPSFSVIGSWYFAVNACSKHKEGAVQFLNYFFKDDTQLNLALNSSSFIPAVRSVYSDSRLIATNPYLPELASAMANMRHRLRHPREPEINTVFENTVKEILVEGKPVKRLLDIAQRRIIAICKADKKK